MACEGCEARRKWLKDNLDEARERTRQLLERLSKANDKDSRTEQHTNTE